MHNPYKAWIPSFDRQFCNNDDECNSVILTSILGVSQYIFLQVIAAICESSSYACLFKASRTNFTKLSRSIELVKIRA